MGTSFFGRLGVNMASNPNMGLLGCEIQIMHFDHYFRYLIDQCTRFVSYA
jgi:hypothetical protein